jgi:hypothetical protein
MAHFMMDSYSKNVALLKLSDNKYHLEITVPSNIIFLEHLCYLVLESNNKKFTIDVINGRPIFISGRRPPRPRLLNNPRTKAVVTSNDDFNGKLYFGQRYWFFLI